MGLEIVVTHRQAPITTQQMRLSKGVEHFYYVLLYTGNPSYNNRPDAWRAWLSTGFHLGVRSAPPATVKEDRLTLNVQANGKSPVISIAGGDTGTFQKVHELLKAIGEARPSLVGMDEDSRADTLMGDLRVAKLLVKPLVDSLRQNGLRQDEIGRYLAMVRRGLLAFTHADVQAVQIFMD